MRQQRLKLFDDIGTDFVGPRGYSEPCFTYLNRSGRPAAHRIRSLLERWFEEFPESGKKELWRRFRSSNDQEHLSAFFELYCHALVRAQGHVAVYHPSGRTENSAQPDFLVKADGEPRFYMECTLAADPSFDAGEKARLNRLIDELNDKLESPNFFVHIFVDTMGKSSAPSSKIGRFLERELTKFDPDVVAEEARKLGWKAWPCLLWSAAGWALEFYLIPKSPEARERKDLRPIGGMSSGLERVDSRRPLLNALKSKSTRYGQLGLPFIIAINSLELTLTDRDIAQALFGTLWFLIDPDSDRPIRAPDGFWLGPKGPQNRRVSAVLIAADLTPWTNAERSPVLWHNPYATNPLGPELWKGPQMIPNPETHSMEPQKGREAFSLLGLSPSWPTESVQSWNVGGGGINGDHRAT